MNFSVCIKQVPDVASATRVQDGEIVQDTERMVLNAYDASALEECLVLREQHGGEIDVVLVGPEKATETIRKALAMGADRATHIVTGGDSQFGSSEFASILAAHFRNRLPDVIACGKQSQDTDSGLTGSMLAALLELPYTTNAVGLEIVDGRLVVNRQADVGREIVELPCPCLVTCSNDMNDPRIPSLKGIMQSKKKTIDRFELAEMSGLDERLGSIEGALVQVKGYRSPPDRPPGKMFEGEPEEQVAQLMAEL